MNRIENLRKMALENTVCHDEFFYRFFKHYTSNSNSPEEERYEKAFCSAFQNMTPHIAEDELIVGRYSCNLTPQEQKEWNDHYAEIAWQKLLTSGGGQDSHMAIDYEIVLNSGINGIKEKIDGFLLNCSESQKTFYTTCKKCLEAVIDHSLRYADEAKKLAEKATDERRKKELFKISEICRNVPANPAQNFHEAVQAVHFVSYCLSMNPYRYCWQQFQLGHPDRYLLPYYEKDIADGTITEEYAQLLLDCLGIQINTRVPNGVSCGYMVGGRDKDSKVVANDLTLMLLQVIDDIKLVYPSVGLCYTTDMDDVYIEKACCLLSKGYSHPAIFNDDTITKGLISYGVPEEEAHNYIHSTCVEITPVGSSNVWVASPYTNMAQLLLDIMGKEYSSFNELISVMFAKLDTQIKNNFEEENNRRKVRAQNSMNPLLSCFVNDCLARGTDIEKGGAKYNWITPSFVGIANLVDSLYALNHIVFEEKYMTLTELKAILDNNFEGNELFRERLLNTLPKYGNDIDEIDCLFGQITEHIADECKKYTAILPNGNIIPSVFCWIRHETFGRETGATPDGRKAGFPLGDGSGACQGRELKGPTASILSCTKWNHHKFIGGVAVNMKFSKSNLGADSLQTMKSLIKTYIMRGGFEIQINVTNKEILEKAVKNPEEYRDLVVRIGGYSDYFVKISPEMQQEIILRTEHKI